jgi:cob(I)alamin adenosyltransferase
MRYIMGNLQKGYVQIYTGNGKGKTTAALGLGLRAAGNKYRVFMVQFLKSGKTGELESIDSLKPYFQIFRFEKPRGFFWTLNEAEKEELKQEVKEGLNFSENVLKEGLCDILILDEIMGALKNELLSESDILGLIENKPDNIEIIMTGRNVPQAIIDKADLVTEMKDIKHYFNNGVQAREGIEY